jgi:hypothetical protein
MTTLERISSALSETYRKIPDWPYQVSDTGRVYSPRTDTILTPYTNETNTYLVVDLRNDGERFQPLIHRLVKRVHDPRENMINLDVHHIDGDPRNNALSNLEWVETDTHDDAHADQEGEEELGRIEEPAPF